MFEHDDSWPGGNISFKRPKQNNGEWNDAHQQARNAAHIAAGRPPILDARADPNFGKKKKGFRYNLDALNTCPTCGKCYTCGR